MKQNNVYSLDLKLKAIELRQKGLTFKQIAKELNIKNVSQPKTWWKWYENGEFNRLSQPRGKQYSFGHDLEFDNLKDWNGNPLVDNNYIVCRFH